jgi:hypothetical protein
MTARNDRKKHLLTSNSDLELSTELKSLWNDDENPSVTI